MIVVLLLFSGLLGYEVGASEYQDDYVNGYYRGNKDGREITTADWCEAFLEEKQLNFRSEQCKPPLWR